MPKVSISLPHRFDRAEARKRTQDCLAQVRKQYGSTLGHLEERWKGDTMDFTFVSQIDMPVSGQAHVEDHAVRLEIELPWMLSMLAGKIKQSIEQEGRKLLDSR